MSEFCVVPLPGPTWPDAKAWSRDFSLGFRGGDVEIGLLVTS